MRHIAITAAALAFGLCGTAALGQTAPRPAAALVGPVTGDPEKDSIGLVLAGPTEARETGCGGEPRFTPEAMPVGTPTGNPEKDSVGFLLLPGDDGCPGVAGRDATRP
jgi:hypothetical protein